ncbi:MAG: class I SAM-dependent methyltransferase [Methanosarcina sp.]|nr:class I SAM-dependent methyltransferase [Methanosarcina sp.]MDD4521501.1 class I SAM-dependent methyltransferase [Methanosarcina sp.]
MPKEMNVKAIFVSRKEIFLKGKKTACHYSVKPKSRCLDIGCGLGESLYYLKQNNCEAYGVEADENVLKMAEKYDLNIKIGLFDPKDYEKEYFDYVTMSQVLEHMVYPVEILNGVHDILKPNGRLIFSVPNSQSLLSTLLRKKWINWHIPYHQQHFTKRSIIKLAERCDFEIESIELVTPTPWLTYQINHLISYPELGKTSVFWSATEEKPLFLKAMFLFTSYIDQFNIMMPVARFLDFLSIGESYVVTFKKL